MTTKLTLTPSLYHQFEKLLLEINLIRQLTSHPGEKGREFEGILKNFLKDIIPNKYKLSTGFVVNESGISKQTDIMVFNTSEISPIYTGYELEIVPIHGLAASIEVKMTLNTSMLDKCQEDAALIKSLFHNSLSSEISLMPKDEQVKYPEPLCILFAYNTDNTSIKTFLDYLNKQTIKNIDLIMLMDKSYYSLNSDRSFYSYVDPDALKWIGDSIFNLKIKPEHRSFLQFYMDFMEHLFRYNSIKPSIVRWASREVLYFDGE
jgi:hypothetical protein